MSTMMSKMAFLLVSLSRKACLIYENGKLVIEGTKSLIEPKQASLEFGKSICNSKPTNFKIRNIAGSFDFSRQSNLNDVMKLCHVNEMHVFEPELFPGLQLFDDLTTIRY